MCVVQDGDGLPASQHDGGKTSETQKNNCLNRVGFFGGGYFVCCFSICIDWR